MATLLQFKAPDKSSLINDRLRFVSTKGIVELDTTTGMAGLLVGSLVALEVAVDPFVAVGYDGVIVIRDTPQVLTVIDSEVNYIVLRSRYRFGQAAIESVERLEESAYLADPEIDWLVVIGVVDLSAGSFTTVPANTITYVERHNVDRQKRSFWREPVANAGALPGPNTLNQDGDVRIALDTGSIYYWNEGLQLWDIFDEVPLLHHRDLEHSNGVVAASSATTLEPSVAGTDIEIAGVPVGSGYTVEGRFLSAPAGVTTIGAGTVGIIRGMIQVYADVLGAVAADYRVQRTAGTGINPQIVGISDNHPAIVDIDLVFTLTGSLLSWWDGEPVPVVGSSATIRYRLYDSTGLYWVEVILPGALPGVNTAEVYNTLVGRHDNDHLLIAHYFWDGSGVLVLGEDKRYFGNLSFAEMSDEFKENVYDKPFEDLRGSMVYSGGNCSVLSGLNLRVSGPIISYVNGRRFTAPGAYAGMLMGAATTNYIYVNSEGMTVVSPTNPATLGSPFADVAVVVTDATDILTIEDRRRFRSGPDAYGMLHGVVRSVADQAARETIPAQARQEGMVVYQQDNDSYYLLEGGVTNSDWLRLLDDSRLDGGFRSVADQAARDAIPAHRRKEGLFVRQRDTNELWTLTGGITNSDWVYALDDNNIRGGLVSVANNAARLNLRPELQAVGMLVRQIDNKGLWQLNNTFTPPAVSGDGTWRKIGSSDGDSANPESGTNRADAFMGDNAGPLPDYGVSISGLQAANRLLTNKTAVAKKSHLLSGMRLLPSFAPLARPYALLKPGSLSLPNGSVADVTSDLEINLGVGGSANYILGAIPSMPSNIYIFLRYKEGGIPTLRADVFPPTTFGTPTSAVSDVGFTSEDFGYVGMLRPIADTGASFAIVWGAASSANLGNGVRVFYFRQSHDHFVDFNFTDTATEPLTIDFGSPVGELYPTASVVQASIVAALQNAVGSSDSVSVVATTDSMLMRLFLKENEENRTETSTTFSITNRSVNFAVTAQFLRVPTGPGTAGNRNFSVTVVLNGIIEDVNNPRPLL